MSGEHMTWGAIPTDAKKYKEALHEAMSLISVPVQFGLEVGLGWGISANEFLLRYPQAALASIDIWEGLPAIQELKRRFGDRHVHSRPGQYKIDVPLQWLYIDGGHEEDEVRRDIEQYYDHLEYGGVLLIDDYDNVEWHYPGVKLAVDKIFNPSSLIKIGGPTGQVALVKK